MPNVKVLIPAFLACLFVGCDETKTSGECGCPAVSCACRETNCHCSGDQIEKTCPAVKIN